MRTTPVNRVARWSRLPVALLVLAISGCSGGDASQEARVSEKLSRSETTAPRRPAAPATEDTFAVRTVVLHVTGMMKSKSGAT